MSNAVANSDHRDARLEWIAREINPWEHEGWVSALNTLRAFVRYHPDNAAHVAHALGIGVELYVGFTDTEYKFSAIE